jgi:dienelactone hydrolase
MHPACPNPAASPAPTATLRSLACSLLVALSLTAMPTSAAIVHKPISYAAGPTKLEGVLLYDDAVKTPRPGLVLVPNWLGVTDDNVAQAAEIASSRYVVLVADVYGANVRPKSFEEAGKAAGALKADRALLRQRTRAALDTLLAQAGSAPLDASKVGAIGFCFGGTAAIELARSGAKVAGVASFHGGLDSPKPEDGKAITAKLLVLHGADDPTIPEPALRAFEKELRDAKVDYQLVSFGGAVHSFTDVKANVPGRTQYHPLVAKRAYGMMTAFFAELFGG